MRRTYWRHLMFGVGKFRCRRLEPSSCCLVYGGIEANTMNGRDNDPDNRKVIERKLVAVSSATHCEHIISRCRRTNVSRSYWNAWTRQSLKSSLLTS
jgi:hypothetical protein